MDIGTAKPDPVTCAARSAPPDRHRGADRAYSAARFRARRAAAGRHPRARGRLPLLVGGTMLYLNALTEDCAALPRADAAVRARIDARGAARRAGRRCTRGWPRSTRRRPRDLRLRPTGSGSSALSRCTPPRARRFPHCRGRARGGHGARSGGFGRDRAAGSRAAACRTSRSGSTRCSRRASSTKFAACVPVTRSRRDCRRCAASATGRRGNSSTAKSMRPCCACRASPRRASSRSASSASSTSSAPSRGATLPGMTVVCGDSHTATHGALVGALAFGIGTSEVEHVLATQTLSQKKMKTMEVRVGGRLPEGVTAKDVVLTMIGRIGTAGGTGYAIEFTASTIRGLSMEDRLTVCNMTIEAGARSGQVVIDERHDRVPEGRPFAPSAAALRSHRRGVAGVASDPAARIRHGRRDRRRAIAPQVTWGTSPEMVSGLGRASRYGQEKADANRGPSPAKRSSTWA